MVWARISVFSDFYTRTLPFHRRLGLADRRTDDILLDRLVVAMAGLVAERETNEFGEWDFDRLTDFDLHPLYMPVEGFARREALNLRIRGSDADEAAFDLAYREAVESDDITAFVLDRAPRLLRLAWALTDHELTGEHMPAIILEARLIAADIRADVRAYRDTPTE